MRSSSGGAGDAEAEAMVVEVYAPADAERDSDVELLDARTPCWIVMVWGPAASEVLV